MSSKDFLELQELLRRGQSDPAAAIEACRRGALLADVMKDLPYSASKQFLPGSYLPGSMLVGVDAIPLLGAAGVTPTLGPAVPIQMSVPGVVVGIHASLAGEPDDVGWCDFQMNMEQTYKLVATIQDSTSQAFCPLSIFPRDYSVLPVLIPCRGDGRWSIQFRNRDTAAAHQPVFALSFLAGKEYLDACMRNR